MYLSNGSAVDQKTSGVMGVNPTIRADFFLPTFLSFLATLTHIVKIRNTQAVACNAFFIGLPQCILLMK